MKSLKSFIPPTQEDIAKYAYFLWETEGHKGGREMDYWLQAEAQLLADRLHEAGLLKNSPASRMATRPRSPSSHAPAPPMPSVITARTGSAALLAPQARSQSLLALI